MCNGASAWHVPANQKKAGRKTRLFFMGNYERSANCCFNNLDSFKSNPRIGWGVFEMIFLRNYIFKF